MEPKSSEARGNKNWKYCKADQFAHVPLDGFCGVVVAVLAVKFATGSRTSTNDLESKDKRFFA